MRRIDASTTPLSRTNPDNDKRGFIQAFMQIHYHTPNNCLLEVFHFIFNPTA